MKKVTDELNMDSPVIFNHKKLEHWHWISIWLVVYDILAATFSYFFGLWLRFDCQVSLISEEYLSAFIGFAPIYACIVLVVFFVLRHYQSLWRFASYHEFKIMIYGTAITTVLHIVGITVLFQRMPISYYFCGPIIQFVLLLSVRFAYRFVLLERSRRKQTDNPAAASNVMIIGAGTAGQMILRDIMHSAEGKEKVRCIIDDNHNK